MDDYVTNAVLELRSTWFMLSRKFLRAVLRTCPFVNLSFAASHKMQHTPHMVRDFVHVIFAASVMKVHRHICNLV